MAGSEIKYVTECLETGWVSSIGKYVEQFEKSQPNLRIQNRQ